MSDVVERVAREIAAMEGYDVDGLAAYAKSHSIAKADYERLIEKSSATIRATLEHYRDNVSEEMAIKGMNESPGVEWPETAERIFLSMITQAIKELDE